MKLPDGLALRCSACGARSVDPLAGVCPAAVPGDDIDHVLVPPEPWEGRSADEERPTWPHEPLGDGEDPFVRYRQLLYPYRLHRAWGGDDAGYLRLVEDLQRRVEQLDGHRFRVTALRSYPGADLLGGRAAPRLVHVKDETSNVSGSHKGRHLFGLALQLAVVARATGARSTGRLAISSCGNAALAAAVVAAAAEYPLEVFVPPSAAPSVLARLEQLGATITICPRAPGERGDPCFTRFLGAVADGASPFAAQGPQHGLTLEGAATLGYELADQLADALADPPQADLRRAAPRLYVQVGGGALAAATMVGLTRAQALGRVGVLPALVTVQTESAAPLARAAAVANARAQRDGVPLAAALAELAGARGEAMWPWEHTPHSVAGGILDDETYDWRELVAAMGRSGGHPVVVSEALLEEANARGRAVTGIDADHTGTAGLAGLYADADGWVGTTAANAPPDHAIVLFTGRRR